MESHTFQRIVAYVIDIFIIAFIALILTIGIPESKKYKEAQKQESTLMEDYNNKKINESEYIDKLYEARYTMSKESVATSLITVVITFGYFAGLTFYNKGQTLGKKLLHIKVVSEDSSEARYSQLIGRVLIHNGCLTSILSIIIIFFIKSNQYIYTIGILELIQSIIMITSFIMIICRKDKRGLHDIICKTKVIEC